MTSRLFLKLFLVFHLFAIISWSLPSSALRTKLIEPFEKYMLWSGLWQGWDMFAPNPQKINFDLIARITFQDGSVKEWVFPQLHKMPAGRRYVMERWRKWRERVRLNDYKAIWPDAARYVARRHRDPQNQPVLVELARFWGETPPPLPGDYQPLTNTSSFTHHYTFFTYRVRPAEL